MLVILYGGPVQLCLKEVFLIGPGSAVAHLKPGEQGGIFTTLYGPINVLP